MAGLDPITMPATSHAVALDRCWRCEACEARYARVTRGDTCRLCGAMLVAEAGPAPVPPLLAVEVRHDRAEFTRAALAFLATCAAIPDEWVARFAVPPDLAPLYVPFRRSRTGPSARPVPDPGHLHPSGQVDTCLAAALDERERTALETLAGGVAADDLGIAPGVGPVLLGGEASPEAAGGDFLVPVWVLPLAGRERPLRLLMEAGRGHFIGFAPTPAQAADRPARVEVLGHWAWLPALFCLLLALLVEAATVQWVLGAVAVATLCCGYFVAAELRHALALARRRLAALLGADGASEADAQRARRRLVAAEQAIAWLPGLYAAIAVCAHVGVTAYVAEHAAAVGVESPEAASLAPWSPIDPNLLVSPFATAAAAPSAFASSSLRDAGHRTHRSTGRVIEVGSGAYRDLASAVAAAAPGDILRIPPGRYDGPRLRIDKDLAIEGRGDVTFVWRGGRGPFIRVAGQGTHVSFSHLRFEAYGINTAVLGDPNQAYGESPAGADQVVLLRDVVIDSPQASAVYSTSPGAHYLVEGGEYRGAGSAIIVIDAAELVIRPYRGAPTRISTDGTSGVANNAVGLTVHGTRRLSIDSVRWAGDPGGDIEIQGDALAVNVGRAAEPSGAQRVLLVDDRGEARHEIAASTDSEPLRFSVHGGELQPLPEHAGDDARTQ